MCQISRRVLGEGLALYENLSYLGGGLSFVAFIVAVIAVVVRNRWRVKVSIVRSLPPNDRLAAIETLAEAIKVDVSSLSNAAKERIVMEQLSIRSRRDRILALTSLIVAVLLASISTLSIWKGNTQAAANAEGAAPDLLNQCLKSASTGAIEIAEQSYARELVEEYSARLLAGKLSMHLRWKGGTAQQGLIGPEGSQIVDISTNGATLVFRYDWQNGALVLTPTFLGYSAGVIGFSGYWRQYNGSGCAELSLPLIQHGEFVGMPSGAFAMGRWTDQQTWSNDLHIWTLLVTCADCG